MNSIKSRLPDWISGHYLKEGGKLRLFLDITFVLKVISVLFPLMVFTGSGSAVMMNPFQLKLYTLIIGHVLCYTLLSVNPTVWYSRLLHYAYPLGLFYYLDDIVRSYQNYTISGILYSGSAAVGFWIIMITGIMPALILLIDAVKRPITKPQEKPD